MDFSDPVLLLIRKPAVIQIDILLIGNHGSDTGQPVSRISGGVEGKIYLQRADLQVHGTDAVQTCLEIIRRAACIVNIRNGHIGIHGGVELPDTGDIPDDLRTEIQGSPLAENPASGGILVDAVPIEQAGHTAVLKDQIDGCAVPALLQLGHEP